MPEESAHWPLSIKAGKVTVKVYKTRNRNSELYQVVYRDHGGERQRVSFSDQSQATREARRIAGQLQTEADHRLPQQGADRTAHERAAAIIAKTGIPIDVMASDYVRAMDVLGEHGSILEAAEFFKAHTGSDGAVR